MSLPGTILFSPAVLLVEGDSDPVLLSGVLQWLVSIEAIDADLNMLGIMATGGARDADPLLRVLLAAQPRPRIAMLVDGDGGGAARVKAVSALLASSGAQHKALSAGTTTEDHVPYFETLYIKAACDYAAEVASLDDKKRQNLQAKAATDAAAFPGTTTAGAAIWLLDLIRLN